MAKPANDISGITDNHERKLNGAERPGRFITGGKPGPGRPIGSRNRLQQDFLRDLHTTWDELGIAALRSCAVLEPSKFVQICANLLPRQVDVAGEVTVEVRQTLQAYRALLGVTDERLIEHDDG